MWVDMPEEGCDRLVSRRRLMASWGAGGGEVSPGLDPPQLATNSREVTTGHHHNHTCDDKLQFGTVAKSEEFCILLNIVLYHWLSTKLLKNVRIFGRKHKRRRYSRNTKGRSREIMMGEGNEQPPLCWLPLWVVELELVAESCTNIGSLYIICQHNSSTP